MANTSKKGRKTLRLVTEERDEPQETAPPTTEKRRLEDFVAATLARWRGHEPEIAILATTTLILAVVAVFAGADLLFTLLIAAAAAVTIWSPWRNPS